MSKAAHINLQALPSRLCKRRFISVNEYSLTGNVSGGNTFEQKLVRY